MINYAHLPYTQNQQYNQPYNKAPQQQYNQNIDIYTSPYRKIHKPGDKSYALQSPMQQHGHFNPQVQPEDPKVKQIEHELKKEKEVNQSYLIKIKDQSKYIEELENKIKVIIKENDRMSSYIEENKHSKFQEFEQKVNMLVNENEKLNQIIMDMESKIKALLLENENLQEMLQESETKSPIKPDKSKQEEIEHLKTQNKETMQQWEGKYQILVASNQELTDLIQQKTLENTSLADQLQSSQSNQNHKISMLIQENEGLQKIVKDLQEAKDERDSYKIILEDLQSKFETLLEENNKINELLQEKMEEDEKVKNLEGKIEILVSENEKLSVIVHEKEKLMETYQGRCNNLESENQRMNVLIKQSQNDQEQTNFIVNNLDAKMQQITNENNHLMILIKEKDSQILLLSESKNELQQKLEEILAENLKSINQPSEPVESGQGKSDTDQIESTIRQTVKTQETTQKEIEQLKFALNLITQQKNQLQLINEQEIQDMKKRYGEYNQTYAIAIQECELKMQAERTAFDCQLAQMKEQVEFYRRKNENCLADCEKLTVSNVEKAKEIELLKLEIKKKGQEAIQLSQTIDDFKAQSVNIEEITLKHNSELLSLKSQLNQLKHMNENSKNEVSKLYSLLKARKEQYEQTHGHLEEMRQQLMQLTAQNTEIQNDTAIQREKLVLLQKQFEAVSKERDEYQLLMEKSSKENQQYNLQLVQKLEELDNKRNYYDQMLKKLSEFEHCLQQKLETYSKQ